MFKKYFLPLNTFILNYYIIKNMLRELKKRFKYKIMMYDI